MRASPLVSRVACITYGTDIKNKIDLYLIMEQSLKYWVSGGKATCRTMCFEYYHLYKNTGLR